MKRSDLKPGHVYAYREGNWGSLLPVLILDNRLCTKGFGGELTTTTGSAQRGGWHKSARGIPAVKLTVRDDDAHYKSKLARAREIVLPEGYTPVGTAAEPFLSHLAVMDGEIRIGTFTLVTHLPYLHGDYLEVMAGVRQNQKAREEVIARQRDEAARLDREFQKLHFRLQKLGISGPVYREHQLVRNLPLDELDRLLTMAERGYTVMLAEQETGPITAEGLAKQVSRAEQRAGRIKSAETGKHHARLPN